MFMDENDVTNRINSLIQVRAGERVWEPGFRPKSMPELKFNSLKQVTTHFRIHKP